LNAIRDEDIIGKIGFLIQDFKVLEMDMKSRRFANVYIEEGAIPKRELNDAIHLACSTCNGIDILISWNFKHLVKRKTRIIANLINTRYNYREMEIIAPPEL